MGHKGVSFVTFNHIFGREVRCSKFRVDNFCEHLWKGVMEKFLHRFWGSRSAPFKVLLAFAVLVMTSMQFAAYAQNSMEILETFENSAPRTAVHAHQTEHQSAASQTDVHTDKHAGKKHPSADTDCEVHCSPLAAFVADDYQALVLPMRSFEPVLHRVLTSSTYDKQARPPKHLI
jgi:hypothetical protein